MPTRPEPPPARAEGEFPDFAGIDGLEHRTLPIFSFQFHPEAREEFARRAGLPLASIDSRLRRDGGRVLAAFLERVRAEALRRQAEKKS